jgi:predicted AlkP superfamily pyrophosphatase or phosphodiesterase
MHRTVVLNVVGLTPRLIGPHTPRLGAFRDAGGAATIGPVLPAVTTTVQTTYLTGCLPADHGIVGNGWYFRQECEVHFWKQADALVERPRLWEEIRRLDPAATVANCFWWYAMFCGADVTVTPRPMYPADGRKIPDLWTHPPTLRQELQERLGQFPLFRFWGPAADITATRWIADCALEIARRQNPTLLLVYLPHLDYALQRHGPDSTHPAVQQALADVDRECGRLLEALADRRIIILSEYGLVPVSRPVHLNRVLRQAGQLAVREELGRELLEPGASAAFAVADHQVAHVHVRQPGQVERVQQLLAATPGVGRVLDAAGKRRAGLDHPRSGELIALAAPDSWFTYYYWLDDARAPDFAPTVDIHRKPGYDPAELFFDPALRWPKLRAAYKLLLRRLGFRALLDVIGLDATRVRGSHGLEPPSPDQGPVLLTNQPALLSADHLPATAVRDLILRHLRE